MRVNMSIPSEIPDRPSGSRRCPSITMNINQCSATSWMGRALNRIEICGRAHASPLSSILYRHGREVMGS